MLAELQGRLPIRVELKGLTCAVLALRVCVGRPRARRGSRAATRARPALQAPNSHSDQPLTPVPFPPRADDFYRILTEPEGNMVAQHTALLATEGVDLTFTDGAVREVRGVGGRQGLVGSMGRAVGWAGGVHPSPPFSPRRSAPPPLHPRQTLQIARTAEEVNTAVDNIGARRLHTVLERILEDVSFDAPDRAAAAPGGRVPFVVDAALVRERLRPLLQKQDLSKYVL